MTEEKILVANWKTYINNYHAINSLTKKIKNQLIPNSINLILCLPFIYLQHSVNALKNTKINIGSQNISSYEGNTNTGETLASMISDLGCRYSIIGHSETREIYRESIKSITLKIKIALKYNITPIICVGENLHSRQEGTYITLLTNQISEFVAPLNDCDKGKLIIAYEPIWSINTCKIPSNYQIEEVIKNFKSIQGLQGSKFIYGGSINTQNINEIVKTKFLDGLLVGKASTTITTLTNIYSKLLQSDNL